MSPLLERRSRSAEVTSDLAISSTNVEDTTSYLSQLMAAPYPFCAPLPAQRSSLLLFFEPLDAKVECSNIDDMDDFILYVACWWSLVRISHCWMLDT